MQHAFGYIQDGKVFLKGFLGRPDRVIGEVKGDEASTLLYFETRFAQIEEKVARLRDAIEENQNKGSFLMKLIQRFQVRLLKFWLKMPHRLSSTNPYSW